MRGVGIVSQGGVVPHGEGLRRAVRWIGEQPRHDRAVLEEAGRRFDLTPLEQDFLARQFGPWGATPEQRE